MIFTRCIFCLDLTNGELFEYFVDEDELSNHASIVIGVRQLNMTQTDGFCSESEKKDLNSLLQTPFEFSSSFSIRSFLSGCFYLDSKGQWKSDGMKVISSLVS